MKKILKLLSLFTAIIGVTFTLAACNNDKPADDPNQNETPGEDDSNNNNNNNDNNNNNNGDTTEEDVTYRVHVTAVSGKPLKNLYVSLSKGGSVVKECYTDINGYADFKVAKDIYEVYVEYDEGYALEDEAKVYTDATGTNLVSEVKLTQHLIDSKMPEGHTYSLGDSMYDFEYLDSEGNTIKLSTLLETNDLVVLNFWYSTCSWCITEFPYLEEAYQTYKNQKVEVVAINPGDQTSSQDSMADIIDFKRTNNLSFPCVRDDQETGMMTAFSINAFPTSIFIDRFGVIAYMEDGAITTTSKWESTFSEFLGEDYQTKYESEEIALPTTEYPGDDEIQEAANQAGTTVTYSTETSENDAKYNWPWVVDEVDGEKCIRPSNIKINNSYSILYMNITIAANKVLAFDYKSSTESADCLYFLKDNRRIGLISGITDGFETKYIYVAGEDEEVQIALCYMKDTSGFDGDDTVYIKNVRFVDVSEVDETTYIIRDCATGPLDPEILQYENYTEVEFNETDGYYYIKGTDKLVLANLLDGYTKFSEHSIYEYYAADELAFLDTEENTRSDIILNYCSYASNSYFNITDLATSGLTPVTKELKDLLVEITNEIGETKFDNQWLELCVYIDQYGVEGQDTIPGDPIKGLAPFSSYVATEGENSVTYDRAIVPRGLYNKFVPETSGVYKIYGIADKETDCFVIFPNGDMKTIDSLSIEFRETYINLAYADERTNMNFFTYLRLEAGQEYYILPCFWNTADTGELKFVIEKVADENETFEILNVCAYTSFTTANDDLTGDILPNKVIDVVLATDKYYHPVFNGQTMEDQFIYLDVAYLTGIFNSENMVDLVNEGAFDFTKDELNNPIEGTDKTDMTAKMQEYLDNNIIEDEDTTDQFYGLIKVDKELAEILQLLMDKYTFEGVNESWLKLCYYVKSI